MSEPVGPTRWGVPDSVTIAAGVDLQAPDPSLRDDGTRQCAASRKDGQRCGGLAMEAGILCAIHDGRSAPTLGHQALAEQRRRAKERSEDVLALRRLGTRALVAEALVEKAAQVREAVHFLADLAADRKASTADRKAASLALIPWMNQALGNPTERVEHHLPSTPEELESLSTSQLEALVAQGRANQAG